MSKNVINEKQTALKLLNQYADSYHLLENQISLLKQENADLKANLQINKEIIQGFFQGTCFEQKINLFLVKTKQENTLLSEKIKNLEALIEQLNIYKKSNSTYQDELKQLKSKVFLLENLLIEKENENKHLKQLKMSPSSSSKKNVVPNTKNEIYVTSPGKIVNMLNDEIEMLREINSKLVSHITTFKQALNKKEKMLVDSEKQISKYKSELTLLKQEKTNTNIMNQLNQYKIANNKTYLGSSGKLMNKSAHLILHDSLSISGGTISPNLNKSRRSLINQIEKLEKINNNKKQINDNNFDLAEEWYETLKHCNLTQDQYIKFCNDKHVSQLTDVIEYLYKLIIDKNIQIKLVNEENDCINLENLKLNKKILELGEKIESLETNNCSKNTKGGHDNSTFVNLDTSINHINDNINLNIMMDYLKEVKQSITSSEFQEGMILDQFDLVSEMSKENGKSNYDEQKNGSNGADIVINK